jgi:hypothetical protein
MMRPIPYSALLAVSLLAATASGATAQSLRAHDPACPLVAVPDPEHVCGRPDWMAAVGGVALIVEPGAGYELVDARQVIAVLGLAGPTVLRSGTAPDVAVTGSVAR